jgi:hypothetical protein
MGSPDVSEAVQALRIYHDLAMAASEDDYLAMCASKEALGVLEALSTNKALQRTDKALASMVRAPESPAFPSHAPGVVAGAAEAARALQARLQALARPLARGAGLAPHSRRARQREEPHQVVPVSALHV